MMRKIYKSLPWLNLSQTADYLRIITGAKVTEDIVLCYCAARSIEVFINVGMGCFGTDDDDWDRDVAASGYHRLDNPEILTLKPGLQGACLCLQGEVMVFGQDGRNTKEQLKWFTAANVDDYSLAFQNFHVEALGDTINADELAATATEVEKFKTAAENHRRGKEQVQLELQGAIAEIGDLRCEISRLHDISAQASESPKKSAYLVIAGMCDYIINSSRSNHTQETIVAEIVDKGWHGAGETTIKHLLADSKKFAEQAELAARSRV
ncbi:hypothetical protein QN375_11505 [Pseudomonas sp. MH9.2]|uniref:hypothetical protein n=1 Tax=Pseudomonas sp. MH9.2 TaxID=3048629 RepID=UPI002AC8D3DB|nr:hypothetical protein [Pseudomonas sp. MH9.2]MEB0026394.1 hypothetical protein [Pseudomonas sp. MH9.2]WPX67321.1 hypothetical protein RHM55_16265 [Pseudomonas sp. MH9.2]